MKTLCNARFRYSLVTALIMSLSAGDARAQAAGINANETPAGAVKNDTRLREELAASEKERVMPFGAKLFSGALGGDARKDSANPYYKIAPGDKITVSLWGALNFSEMLTVDSSGNIFLPEIGPIELAGVPYRRMNDVIRARVLSVYKEGAGVYADIAGSQPVSVYVTGDASYPGRYGGAASDSILHFLDRAGGPDLEQGSFRNIEVRRGDRKIARVDLYAFLLDGRLPEIVLREGDTIFVHSRGYAVTAGGEVYKDKRFEFTGDEADGLLLEELARPKVGATHVSVSGVRDGKPFKHYMTRYEFASFALDEGDAVFFHDATRERQIRVFAEGVFEGSKALIMPVGSTLVTALHQLQSEKGRTDVSGISLERLSVAKRQKKSLEDSLRRLEQSVVYAPVTSGDDAQIRRQESEAVRRFIENARKVEPGGRIVVSENGVISDIRLEDGDKIIVPELNNIVFVSGEAVIPQAIVEKPGAEVSYYIERAGGYSRRADKEMVLLRKVNGAVISAEDAPVEGGDEIIIMPRVYMNKMQFARDITDIMYKIAIAAAVPLNFLDDN